MERPTRRGSRAHSDAKPNYEEVIGEFTPAPLSVSLGASTTALIHSRVGLRRSSGGVPPISRSDEGRVLREEEGGTTRDEGVDVVEKLTIALMGGGATGKSSLIVRMLHDRFEEVEDNDPTLLDEYELPYHFENRTCTPPHPSP
jgi:hypothetical protein